MLLLRDLEERNIVEEQALELIGRQIEQLVARAMQADFLQLPDLACYMQAFRHVLLPFFLGCRVIRPRSQPSTRVSGCCMHTAIVISNISTYAESIRQRYQIRGERYIS